MTNLKLLLKMAASLLALLLLLIAFVVFVNRDDRPPSDAVVKLQGIAAASTPVADRDNAYVYVLGFNAPDGADVMAEGVARVEGLRRLMETPGAAVAADTPGEKLAQDKTRLLERYERLLEFRQWREIWPSDLRSPHAPFSRIADAQRLLYSRALSLADQGDAANCRRTLEKDYRFWRMVLAESSSAEVKTAAAHSIELHFEMGNHVVRRFPPALAMTAIPDGWREPFSDRERSLAKIMANEWRLSDSYGLDIDHSDELLARLFGSLLFQPQATSNATADRMLRLADLFDNDYAEIRPAAGTFLAAYGIDKKGFSDVGVYNPVGKKLLNMGGMDAYAALGFRVANLEGIRRMALLAAQLRSSGVKRSEVAEGARKSDLRDPYDAREFAWDEAQNSLVFHRTIEGRPDFMLAY